MKFQIYEYLSIKSLASVRFYKFYSDDIIVDVDDTMAIQDRKYNIWKS